MKNLETGKDKIQKICDMIRDETLEPAKQEAREILENARLQAETIVQEAKKKAEELLLVAKNEMAEKQKIFEASLQLSCRQGIELLKQKIEEQLFTKSLAELIAQEMADPKVIARLIESLLKSLEEKGVEEEFVAVIPKQIPPRSINAILGHNILEKLHKQTVVVGDFAGGIQMKLKGENITLDLSEETVRELVAQYIRKDFREMLFRI